VLPVRNAQHYILPDTSGKHENANAEQERQIRNEGKIQMQSRNAGRKENRRKCKRNAMYDTSCDRGV